MKVTSTSCIVLLGAIASSTVHTSLAVARPGPASVSTSTSHRSGLLVDREGNLYSPSSKIVASETTIGSNSKTANFRRRNNIAFAVASALQLRGGDTSDSDAHLCVDNEGNLYTPKVPNKSHLTTPSAAISSTEGLRGGNQNVGVGVGVVGVGVGVGVGIGIGGLCVDSEGQFYFAASDMDAGASDSSSASDSVSASSGSLLKTLRGGSLCVDNEGNLYSPRQAAKANANAAAIKTPVSSSRRRYGSGSGNASGPVLLAKNKLYLPKKTTGGGKPKKSSYHNNARMET